MLVCFRRFSKRTEIFWPSPGEIEGLLKEAEIDVLTDVPNILLKNMALLL